MFKTGDALPNETRGPIRRQHLVEWCAAENDYFPLHYDDDFARSFGFDAAIVQGTYKLALLGQYLSHVFGPTMKLVRLDIRYAKPDPIGTMLRLTGTVVARTSAAQGTEYALELQVSDAAGTVTAKGRATVVLS